MKSIPTKESSLLISVMDIHQMSAARWEQVSANFAGDNLLSKSEHQRTCSADSFRALRRSGIAYCAINKWKSTHLITRSRQSGERWSRVAIAACSHFHFSPGAGARPLQMRNSNCVMEQIYSIYFQSTEILENSRFFLSLRGQRAPEQERGSGKNALENKMKFYVSMLRDASDVYC